MIDGQDIRGREYSAMDVGEDPVSLMSERKFEFLGR